MTGQSQGPDVWGAARICEHYNISSAALAKWTSDPAFPPATDVGKQRVWDRAAVVAWHRDRDAGWKGPGPGPYAYLLNVYRRREREAMRTADTYTQLAEDTGQTAGDVRSMLVALGLSDLRRSRPRAPTAQDVARATAAKARGEGPPLGPD
jgi:hypothetical protein